MCNFQVKTMKGGTTTLLGTGKGSENVIKETDCVIFNFNTVAPRFYCRELNLVLKATPWLITIMAV